MRIHRDELKQWAWQHLRGIENTIYPSFTPDLSQLDEEGIRLDVQQSIRHGFASTLVACETGLSFDEAKRLVSIVADEARGKIGVAVTLLFNSIEENIAMAQHAEKEELHTALLGYPFNFYPKTTEQVYEVSRQVCEAAPELGIMLYPSHKFNLMRLTPMGFPIDVLERLTDIPNVVGCKIGVQEPGFKYEAFYNLADKVVIQDPWERWWPLLTRGFKLQYVGAGAYEMFQSPEKPYLVNMFNLLLEGKYEEAMKIYWMLTPVRMVFEKQFMPTQMIGTYHWPQMKFYQWLSGGNGGFTRQPVMKLTQYEMDEARDVLRAIGIQGKENDEEFFVGKSQYAKGKRIC